MDLLAKGLILGFSIAAPVGPIGILCIHRTLERGKLFGFVSGLGAATADAAYGAVAAFGLTAISGLLLGYAVPIRIIGGLCVAYIAVQIFTAQPAEDRVTNERNGSLLQAYASTVFLTIANPSTIISFLAVFAGFGLTVAADYTMSAIVVLGVFLSALWWLVLSQGVGFFRDRFSPANMIWVNRLSGVLMGLLAFVSFMGAMQI